MLSFYVLKVLDQKTGSQLGQLSYAISSLLKEKDLTMLYQPMNLQKSGPESKIILAAQLKVVYNIIHNSIIFIPKICPTLK